jgi:DNA-binding MarR family transcriptional regulator
MEYQEYCTSINELMQNVGSKYTQAQNQQFAGQNLTASQIGILLLLDQNGSMRVSDVAAALSMRESNVSNICTRLENAGLILRDRTKTDRRVVKVELTVQAEKKMGDIKSSVSDFHRKMQECVSADDLKDIHIGLTKLNKLFDLFLDLDS